MEYTICKANINFISFTKKICSVVLGLSLVLVYQAWFGIYHLDMWCFLKQNFKRLK